MKIDSIAGFSLRKAPKPSFMDETNRMVSRWYSELDDSTKASTSGNGCAETMYMAWSFSGKGVELAGLLERPSGTSDTGRGKQRAMEAMRMTSKTKPLLLL